MNPARAEDDGAASNSNQKKDKDDAAASNPNQKKERPDQRATIVRSLLSVAVNY
jgi:hypothetical protein